jgi:hypothetical protein
VVRILDQVELLVQLEQRLSEQPGMTEAEAFNRAIATAHDEDVSAWSLAIGQRISAMGGEAMPLLELQGATPCGYLEECGMPYSDLVGVVVEWILSEAARGILSGRNDLGRNALTQLGRRKLN